MGHPKHEKNANNLCLADFQGAALEDDRRREARVAVAKVINVLLCDRGLDSGTKQVGVIDCSPNGLGITTTEPINLGERFIAELQLDRKLFIVYTVRHCRLHGATYKIGCALTGFLGGIQDDPKKIFDALVAQAGLKR